MMGVLVAHVQPRMEALGYECVRYQWDNNSIQVDADTERMGLDPSARVHLPEYSPDMNKPIEHVFAQLKRSIMEELAKHEGEHITPALAQRITTKCFKALNKASIQKDISSLPLTWRVIAADQDTTITGPGGKLWCGTGGNYPPAELR